MGAIREIRCGPQYPNGTPQGAHMNQVWRALLNQAPSGYLNFYCLQPDIVHQSSFIPPSRAISHLLCGSNERSVSSLLCLVVNLNFMFVFRLFHQWKASGPNPRWSAFPPWWNFKHEACARSTSFKRTPVFVSGYFRRRFPSRFPTYRNPTFLM